MITTWGLKYFGAAAPKYIKVLFILVVFPAITTFLANLEDFGLTDRAVHILKIFSPVIGGAIAGIRELFGKKSPDDIIDQP